MKFTENDIRPNAFKTAMEEALQKDLDSLVSKKASFVMVSCPACGSLNNHFAFEKYSFRFVCCDQCDTIYMNPRATQEILKDFYANSVLYDYWNRYVFPASKEVRRKKIFKSRVKRILEICESYNVAMHCLIEVGAGYGIFCEEMKKRGRFKHIIAVEPNAELAESCSSVGVEVINDSIENIHSLKTSPNLIACFEVIEHLFSPEAFLLHCKHLVCGSWN